MPNTNREDRSGCARRAFPVEMPETVTLNAALLLLASVAQGVEQACRSGLSGASLDFLGICSGDYSAPVCARALLYLEACGIIVRVADPEHEAVWRIPGAASPPACPRCKRAGQEEHPCPYQEEMGGNGDVVCTCCDVCMSECARDI